jgi:hypothetical protein
MKFPCMFLVFVLAVSPMASAQVTADLTIANQYVSGSTFYFDIYITRTGSNDVYLSTGDFVLTFNAGNFTSPAITRGAASTYSLTSTDATPVGTAYRGASAISISGNEMRISLNLISFGDQTDFDANVAKITNSPNTFRFGTYGISGITTFSSTMGLQWKTAGAGTNTRIFSYENTEPWNSREVTVNAINPSDQALPITLSAFLARVESEGRVTLTWTTMSETGNYGFEVQRSSNAKADFTTLAGSFQPGYGTTAEKHDYGYTDETAGPGTWYYRLRQIDLDKTEHFSEVISINGVTGVSAGEVLPTEFALHQNYPNPFNPATLVRYQLPVGGSVKLAVFDLVGREVAVLVNEPQAPGIYAVKFNAAGLASGVYLYRLQAGTFVQSRKMILMK